MNGPPTDDQMRAELAHAKRYTLAVLIKTERYADEGSPQIVWEHGRRNFVLRAEGKLAIVCPVNDGTAVSGYGIFVGSTEEVRQILDDDPAVQAGIFTYELHPTVSFPGDRLP